MQTGRDRDMYQMTPYTLQVMRHYDDVEYTLKICVLDDAAKYEFNPYCTINRKEIHQKIQRHAIPASRFTVDHTIEVSSPQDVESGVAEMIIDELTGHAIANVVEPFVKTLADLQTTPFLTSRLVMWLYVQLRPNG